jgi:hypothetical protein
MARRRTGCDCCCGNKKGRFGALFYFLAGELLQERDELHALGSGKRSGDPSLVRGDAPLQSDHHGSARPRERQLICSPVGAAPAFDQPALLELVDQAHHRRTIEADSLREPALCNAGIGVDQEQNAHASGRKLADALREIVEYPLLREAQTVAQQARKQPGANHPPVEFLFGIQAI